MIKTILRFLGFLTVAFNIPIKHWGLIWDAAVNPNGLIQRSTQLLEDSKRERYHLHVQRNVSKVGFKLYLAFRICEAHQLLKSIDPDTGAFAEVCPSELEPTAVLALYPTYQLAVATGDPNDVVDFINSPILQRLEAGTGILCGN